MLGHGHGTGRLDPLDIGHAHGRHQQRVLTEPLIGAAALGHPVDVEVGALDHVESLAGGLRAQHLPIEAGDGRVERRGHAQRGRQLGHVLGPVGQALRSVLQREGRDAEPGNAGVDVLVVPRAHEDHLAQLLGDRHPFEDGPGQLRRGLTTVDGRLQPLASRDARCRVGRRGTRLPPGGDARVSVQTTTAGTTTQAESGGAVRGFRRLGARSCRGRSTGAPKIARPTGHPVAGGRASIPARARSTPAFDRPAAPPSGADCPVSLCKNVIDAR